MTKIQTASYRGIAIVSVATVWINRDKSVNLPSDSVPENRDANQRVEGLRSTDDAMDKVLSSMFRSHFGVEAAEYEVICGSGSNRCYSRLSGGGYSAVGVAGEDRRENEAFLSIGAHLLAKGIRVPEVYAVSDDGSRYLQQDLGAVSLYDAVAEGRKRASAAMAGSGYGVGKAVRCPVQAGMRTEDMSHAGQPDMELETTLKEAYSADERRLLAGVIAALPEIQMLGAEGLDFGTVCPVPEFDRRSIMFDLNYFKYCFLKVAGIHYDEMLLEDDFEALAEDLLSVGCKGFMYRDFQARNVMLYNGVPYFIDFQGGRHGPVHYDVASFVWQAKACYPPGLKEELISLYVNSLRRFRPVDETGFRKELELFVLLRTLQVLGAYGFRGYFERKRHFLESIPYAVANVRELLGESMTAYPYLSEVLAAIADDGRFSFADENR